MAQLQQQQKQKKKRERETMRYLIYMYIQHECIVLPIWLFVPTKVTCGESPPVFHVRWSTIHTGRHGFRRSDRIGSFFPIPLIKQIIILIKLKGNGTNRTEPNRTGFVEPKTNFYLYFLSPLSSCFPYPIQLPTCLPTYICTVQKSTSLED